MASNAEIAINARDRASSVIQSVNSSLRSMQRNAESAAGVITGVLGAAALSLTAVATAGFQTNRAIETSFSKWKTLTGSVQGANQQLKFLQDYAKESPFDFQGIDEAATALKGYGLNIKEVNAWIPTLGNMASVMGGGTAAIKRAGLALGQMTAKGKVSAEEMNQLAENGVNAWGFLADGMGLTVGQVRKLSEEGKLMAKDALPLIKAGMDKAFGGGVQQYMKTTAGQWDNLTESARLFAGQLTQPVYDWFGSSVLPLLNSALDKLSQSFEGGVIQGFQNLANSSTSVKVTLLLLAGIIGGALIGALVLLGPLILSAALAFAPFVVAAMAVAAVATLIITYWEPIKTFFINTFGPLINTVIGFFKGIWANIQPILMMVVTFIQQKLAQIKAFWDQYGGQIMQAASNVWNFISGLIQGVLNVILAIFNFVWPFVKELVLSVWEGIKGAIDGAITFILGIIKFFTGLFTGDWKLLWEGIKDMLSGAIQFIWNIFTTFFQGKILGVLGKFASSGLKYITDWAGKAWSAIVKWVSDVVGKFGDWAAKIIQIVVDWVKGIGKKIDDFVNSIINKISSFNSKLGDLVRKGWEGAKKLVADAVKATVDTVKSFFNSFLNAGKGLLDNLIKGIKSGFDKAVGAVKSGLDKIRSFLPFSPAKRGPLSDLDKSGASFFPTWYNAALAEVPAMRRSMERAFAQINDAGGLALEAFSGGRTRVTITHEIVGEVTVEGDQGRKEVIEVAKQRISELGFFSDLRQVIRQR